MSNVTRALISVYDKSHIVELGKVLTTLGVELLSTGGTAKSLRDAGLAVVDIAEYTGSPEVFEGRLKTLHPRIHGGILYRRDDAHHAQQAKTLDIGPIDMVVVNLYPFEEVTSKPGCSFQDAIENIDIGGPTMLRSAAKNHESVTVIVDPSDYEMVARELMDSGGRVSRETNLKLAKKAFVVSARYEAAIATFLNGLDDRGEHQEGLPGAVGLVFSKIRDLRYGENPHQRAALYRNARPVDIPSLVSGVQLHGKELSYNNITDADAALAMITDFQRWPYACAIMKHANPCGVAVSKTSLRDAFEKALSCDPLSAFGGIIGVTAPVDGQTAAAITESFFEVIVAPHYEEAAMAVLTKKKNIRLLEVPGLGQPSSTGGLTLRRVAGGMLLQDRDACALDVRAGRVVTTRPPTDEEWEALAFAWRVVKHVTSNAIVFTAKDRTVGIGAGQMSRIDAAKIAVMKARESLTGTVVASDAFFPFRDGVDEAARAGATAVVQPGGSVRDDEVIAAADEHGIAMVLTGQRHFRH